jgi:hypothetical protein
MVQFYDFRDQKAEALEAKQSWITTNRAIQSRYSPMMGDFFLAVANQDLGLRLEEQKRYSEAESRYQDAINFAIKPDSKVSEELRFTSEMGRSRCLTLLSHAVESQGICSTWKVRLHQLGQELRKL